MFFITSCLFVLESCLPLCSCARLRSTCTRGGRRTCSAPLMPWLSSSAAWSQINRFVCEGEERKGEGAKERGRGEQEGGVGGGSRAGGGGERSPAWIGYVTYPIQAGLKRMMCFGPAVTCWGRGKGVTPWPRVSAAWSRISRWGRGRGEKGGGRADGDQLAGARVDETERQRGRSKWS